MGVKLGYNYSKYWKKSGKSYAKKFKYTELFYVQEKLLLQELRKLEFKSVFELGCGFGRITELIKDNFDVPDYDAIDISKHQIKNANVPGVNFEVADFNEYSPQRQYDLVIASEILMHIPPHMIEKFTAKYLSMSKKYNINIDVYGKWENLAEHNFVHPYMRLFKNYETEAIDIKNGQFMFVVKK
jgi:trans-aconitate methyltransferase